MKLKSTKKYVYDLPWSATAIRPWSDGYLRVLIPSTNKWHKNSIQIVHKSNLE